jgi:hypothetical protein
MASEFRASVWTAGLSPAFDEPLSHLLIVLVLDLLRFNGFNALRQS